MFNVADLIHSLLVLAPLIVAVVLHELAHGWAAYRLGDPTAKLAGRLTLNPIRHLDLFGSFVLPLVLKLTGSPVVFGYAKPVPVNFGRLSGGRTGIVLVSAAGVLANLALATVASAVYRWLPSPAGAGGAQLALLILRELCAFSVVINVVLAVFNLIPVPPLDGSRILAVFLPPALRFQFARLERFGMILIFALLLTGSVDWVYRRVMAPILDFLL